MAGSLGRSETIGRRYSGGFAGYDSWGRLESRKPEVSSRKPVLRVVVVGGEGEPEVVEPEAVFKSKTVPRPLIPTKQQPSLWQLPPRDTTVAKPKDTTAVELGRRWSGCKNQHGKPPKKRGTGGVTHGRVTKEDLDKGLATVYRGDAEDTRKEK